jgi:hypothetical protein
VGKAIGIVLKRDGWLVLYIILLTAILDYWREGQISVVGLLASGLVSAAVLIAWKVPNEIRRLEAERVLL